MFKDPWIGQSSKFEVITSPPFLAAPPTGRESYASYAFFAVEISSFNSFPVFLSR